MKAMTNLLGTAAPLLALGLLAQASSAAADDAVAATPAQAPASVAAPAAATPKTAAAPAAKDGFTASGSVYFGTVLRTTDADPELLFSGNAAAIGGTGTSNSGKNQDDGNLNFQKWSPVSTTVKGMLELRYVFGQHGLVGQAQAWYDYELKHGNRPWGNSVNDYAADEPLSDKGFSSRSKFQGIAAGDVYAYGEYANSGWKVGLQRLDWGNKFTLTGGLGDLSPRDLPAQRRAGTLKDEGRVAVPAISGHYSITNTLNAEAFVQTHFVRNVPMGCGTFYSQTDFVAEGCNKVVFGMLTDRGTLAAGQFVGRAETETPGGLQGGLGLTQKLTSINSTIGFYLAQFHSRNAYYGAIRSGRPAASPLFVPGNADGLNPQYFTQYADDIRIAALTFNKKLQYGAVLVEASYRPNQPFQYNAGDLLNGFVSKTNPTPLRAKTNALAPGEAMEGFERHKVAQLNLGFAHGLPGVLGAKSGQAAMELAYKWAGIPDVEDMRFGRADVYGQAAVKGGPACTGSAKSCSTDGYISSNSVAYRMRTGLLYPQVATGLDITPSFVYGYDIYGWSEDGLVSAGRQFASVSVKGEFRKTFDVELAWQPIWGGAYNNLKDRDALIASVGYRF
ncbi:MAG: DUF1302 family protein [Pseudomonadota bacterium]